jgi:hypothetical protein
MILRRSTCGNGKRAIVELGLKWTQFTSWTGIEDDGEVVLDKGLQGFLGRIERG